MTEPIEVKTEDKIKNILIVGVGGQGIVLASEVLASVCLTAGHDVKQSEVHGMAQRGGSVTSHVRFGKEVFSPTIEKGEADIMVSFELMESMRWLEYLASDGIAIVNKQRIDPMTVASGKAKYPGRIAEVLKYRSSHLDLVDGMALARKAGNLKTINVILLGVLSKHLEFDKQLWVDAISNRVPEKTKDINIKAFELGRAMN
jgi:indolepyruvate ferredoxin oxidoreductase, beta subunit